jgi:hypothetical protein
VTEREKDERPRCKCGIRFDPYADVGTARNHPDKPPLSSFGENKTHWYDKKCGRCGGPVEFMTERERASSSGYDTWYECPKDHWVSA